MVVEPGAKMATIEPASKNKTVHAIRATSPYSCIENDTE